MILISIIPAAARARIVAAALLLSCFPALAAPATDLPAPLPAPARQGPVADPLLQLLVDRGVLQAGLASLQPAVALAQQARDLAAGAVIAAMAFLDLPYAQGGVSVEQGFDCSGFTRHVFKHTSGLMLPRSAEQQAQSKQLQQVAAEELQPGDLVFFNTVRKAFSHVGIYVGDGRFVHSPRLGAAVRMDSLRQAYWSTRFDGARRAAPSAAAGG